MVPAPAPAVPVRAGQEPDNPPPSPAAYDPQSVEARWRRRWEETALYRTPEVEDDGRSTFYCLDFFPYPSGDGLSVGHCRNYVPSDVIARYYRMRGYAVLHPMGWDAFGLPAENEAIRKGVHPSQTTARYAANYRRQMTLMGCSYDWEREINSSTPDFYRWTQWFFLLLYRRGLAYRAVGQQWWCPTCKTVLANEQVEAGNVCWRGHPGVAKRDLAQWYFRISAYADDLLAGLETLDWPEHVLAMQRNWVGRSQGVEFEMAVEGSDARFAVFTTRPDTMYGVTFVVVAPEHPLVEAITTPEQSNAVADYRQAAARRSEVERLQQTDRPRDGVFTGAYALSPVAGISWRVPIYVADYVLFGYGSGAIMAVPAHDERDFDFAARYDIPAIVVVAPPGWDQQALTAAYTGPGVLVNSGPWDGLPSNEAAERIADWLEAQGIGRRTVQYRMRDWLISRQRYWGAPIPMVYCDTCGVVPVPERDLPVPLPAIETWRPGEDGRSPLANVAEFVNTSCPRCGRPARRETDTMDGFACSSWYFLRFVSPHYDQGPFDPAALAHWGAPDLYVGGAEHAVMHLLYARFWTKVMADSGIVPFREPFPRLRSQGIMHIRDPQTGAVRRMSKSAGNVVTPDSVAERHGADALRVYLLFMAPFENQVAWEEEGINGARRFLSQVWRLASDVADAGSPAAPAGNNPAPLAMGRLVRRITADIEAFKFNTAIAALMEGLNTLSAYRRKFGVTGELGAATRTFICLLAPFAPHIAEELWQRLGGSYSVHQQPWPTTQEHSLPSGKAVSEDSITLVVQVDGRVRDRLSVAASITEAEVCQLAMECDGVRRHMKERPVARIIYVPGRLVNVVTE
jgi:leucyl-tRNA synthetase